MPKQVRWRRGTTAEHATFTGAQGEVTVDITKKTLVVHDGVTPGGWPVNNTPGGGVSGQALAISAAGTDAITPGASVLNHFVDATVSAGAGAYLRKLVLSHVGAADGKRIAFHFTLPASANPVIELRDGVDTGTVLLSFTPRPDAAVPRSADCEYRGGAWRLVDSNEVADKIRESILDAKGRLPVRGASEVVALPAPGNGQMLVGNPNAPEGMNWTGVATARESLLNLYRERVVNPSPLPVAAGDNSIALGAGAYARDAGMVASANGGFNNQAATLQRWAVLLRNQTTDATQTELFADGASQRLVLSDNYTWHFEVRVVAREQGGESAAYHFMGCIKRGTGAASTALVGSVDSPMADKEDVAGWSVVVDADTTNGALRVRVTGGASQTLRWGADVSVVEVFNAGGVAPPVLNDLVLFLKCEEASGTRFDSSGNDLHFSAVGGPLSGAGKIGAGLALDGDGQMIEHADDPLLRLTGDFTIAFWANFNAGNESVTLQRWGDNTTAAVGIEWYAADGGVPGQQRLYAHLVGSAPSSVFLNFAPVVGTWYLIVLRVNGTTMKLSVNAGTPAMGTASARAGIARPTTFGGIWGMASFSAFNGRLDHIMQWNRALSDGEVAGLFNDGGGLDIDPGDIEPPAPVQSPGLTGGYYNESDGYDATIKGFQLNSHGILPNGTDLVQFHQQSPPVPQFGVEPPVFKVLFTIMARPFGENPPNLSGLPDPEPDNAFEVEMPGFALNLGYDGQPENLLARWMWTLESYVFVTFNWDWFNATDLSKFNVYCKVRTYAEGQALGPVRLLKTPGAPDPV